MGWQFPLYGLPTILDDAHAQCIRLLKWPITGPPRSSARTRREKRAELDEIRPTPRPRASPPGPPDSYPTSIDRWDDAIWDCDSLAECHEADSQRRTGLFDRRRPCINELSVMMSLRALRRMDGCAEQSRQDLAIANHQHGTTPRDGHLHLEDGLHRKRGAVPSRVCDPQSRKVPTTWSARVNQQQRGGAVGASVVAP